MKRNHTMSLHIGSQMMDLNRQIVMGILNCTPDSFAVHVASLDDDAIVAECGRLMEDGADIIDIGACSTRPDSDPVSEQEEWRRLDIALSAIRRHYPHQLISLDTFRSSIARKAIKEYNVQMINDVSGMADPDMLDVVSCARVPYVLTHPRAACADWTDQTDVPCQLLSFFSFHLDRLHRAGVADVIIDPGLGFGKTIDQNYTILRHLSILHQLNAPVMIGLSRKSMLYKPLGITPETALNATTAAHVLALLNGADILRVHDVPEARQTLDIVKLYLASKL